MAHSELQNNVAEQEASDESNSLYSPKGIKGPIMSKKACHDVIKLQTLIKDLMTSENE